MKENTRENGIKNPYMTTDYERKIISSCCASVKTHTRDANPDKVYALKVAGFDALMPCKTADEVFQKLSNYQYDEKLAATIYSDMDKNIKSNIEDMKFLISKDELAFLHVDDSIRTQHFVESIVKDNPDVYGLLSKVERCNPAIVKAYVNGVLDSVGRYEDGNKYFAINQNDIPYMVAGYKLADGCPRDEFYSKQNYEMVFERSLHSPQQFHSGSADFHDEVIASGVESTYLSMARHTQASNIEAFDAIEAQLIRDNWDLVRETIQQEAELNNGHSSLGELVSVRCPELAREAQEITREEDEITQDMEFGGR